MTKRVTQVILTDFLPRRCRTNIEESCNKVKTVREFTYPGDTVSTGR